MKKIIVDKTEGIAEVIDRILNEPDNEVSLVIPKGSALGRSVSNFHLLKREADSAGREVAIESVDETILAFATESGLESSHPLWKGVRGAGGFSDIVSRRESQGVSDDDDDQEEIEEKKKTSKKGAVAPVLNKRSKRLEQVAVEEDEQDEAFEEEEEDDDRTEEKKQASLRNRFFDSNPNLDEDRDEKRGSSKKFILVIVLILLLAGVGLYIATAFFDHADISINFKQTPWSYQQNLIADKAAVAIDPTNNIIPAQIFTATKNVTQLFPGSLVQQVSQKAQGTITIYNAYSSAPQTLVATTRFLTPSGQIFRLVSNVTVPGETGTAGNLSPSSINAAIVADQAGPTYNVGPVPHLTIPGFQDDAGREAGFYGVITSSTTGGFIGQRATPTAGDIANAKASTTALLQAALQGGFSGNYPNNFKILDGATITQIGKLTVNTTTDANGNFSVFGQATLQAIGFDESALKTYLLSLAQTTEPSSTFKTITLSYADVTADFTKGQVSFALSAQANLEPAFSADDFASSIEGQSISSARSTIATLPNLADGEISVWPSWLWSIPSDPNKIHISVN